jgi:hypothetical protein
MQASVYIGLYPLYGADEVSGEVVTEQSLSYMLLFMVPEQVETGTVFLYFGFISLFGICFMVLCSQFCLSFSGHFCNLMKKC